MAGYKRIVVKVGSSLLTDSRTGYLNRRLVKVLSGDIYDLTRQGIKVILVSSGAIASGVGALKLRSRPRDLSSLQAAAAVGQGELIRAYSEAFKKKGLLCAQILLTWDDFNDRKRYLNAKHSLSALLGMNVVPIVNENDSVSVEEIKLGDNDKLSALVTNLIEADLLVILSDVDGLIHPDLGTLRLVEKIDKGVEKLAKGTKRNFSVGGMATKIEAARIVTDSGVPCILACGSLPKVLNRIIQGERVGTLFLPRTDKKLAARKRWIAFGSRPAGKIVVDDGAKEALVKGFKSLLSPGVIGFEGYFESGDVVSILDTRGQEFGRGLVNCSSRELSQTKGKRSCNEVIHRNNLVILWTKS
jgi:glutamate 5-kinase